MKARKAVRRALENQRDELGFSFVEILSPCPTIWGKDPVEARRWVGEKLVPTFPLNVFRDRKPEIPQSNEPPQRLVSDVSRSAPRTKPHSQICPNTRTISATTPSRLPASVARAFSCSASC